MDELIRVNAIEKNDPQKENKYKPKTYELNKVTNFRYTERKSKREENKPLTQQRKHESRPKEQKLDRNNEESRGKYKNTPKRTDRVTKKEIV